MSDTELAGYLIRRDFDDPISEDAFAEAAGGAMDHLAALVDEGVGIRWVRSQVRTRADGAVVGTFCHYEAEDEAAIREHAARAGLPATRIDRHGSTLANEN